MVEDRCEEDDIINLYDNFSFMFKQDMFNCLYVTKRKTTLFAPLSFVSSFLLDINHFKGQKSGWKLQGSNPQAILHEFYIVKMQLSDAISLRRHNTARVLTAPRGCPKWVFLGIKVSCLLQYAGRRYLPLKFGNFSRSTKK